MKNAPLENCEKAKVKTILLRLTKLLMEAFMNFFVRNSPSLLSRALISYVGLLIALKARQSDCNFHSRTLQKTPRSYFIFIFSIRQKNCAFSVEVRLIIVDVDVERAWKIEAAFVHFLRGLIANARHFSSGAREAKKDPSSYAAKRNEEKRQKGKKEIKLRLELMLCQARVRSTRGDFNREIALKIFAHKNIARAKEVIEGEGKRKTGARAIGKDHAKQTGCIAAKTRIDSP